MAHRNQKIPCPDRHRRLASLSRLGGMELAANATATATTGGRRGYYTQDDIREVVEYARALHIEVIPEIEMPGHSEEVLASPELVQRQPYEPDFCIGNEQDVRIPRECALRSDRPLPSEYIHIGGDEASKRAGTCPRMCRPDAAGGDCRTSMNCKSYLVIRRIDGSSPKGRRLLGWDEILQGGWARRHGHVVARHRGRDRRGQGRTPRRDGSLELLLPRFLPGRPHP